MILEMRQTGHDGQHGAGRYGKGVVMTLAKRRAEEFEDMLVLAYRDYFEGRHLRPGEALVALLTDARHFADVQDLDLYELLDESYKFYLQEKEAA